MRIAVFGILFFIQIVISTTLIGNLVSLNLVSHMSTRRKGDDPNRKRDQRLKAFSKKPNPNPNHNPYPNPNPNPNPNSNPNPNPNPNTNPIPNPNSNPNPKPISKPNRRKGVDTNRGRLKVLSSKGHRHPFAQQYYRRNIVRDVLNHPLSIAARVEEGEIDEGLEGEGFFVENEGILNER